MKTILLFIFVFLTSCFCLFAQGYRVYPGSEVLCPNSIIEYKLQICTIVNGSEVWSDVSNKDGFWEITNGTVFTGSIYNLNDPISIKWNDTSDEGKIEAFYVMEGNTYSYARSKITINSIIDKTPGEISGSSSILMGEQTLTYHLDNNNLMKFPNGQDVNSYSWIIPAGWSIGGVVSDGTNVYENMDYTVTVTTSSTSGGEIKVAGENTVCTSGAKSNYRTFTVERTLPDFAISLDNTTPMNSFLNGDFTPCTFRVPLYSWATYSWTINGGGI